jgi:hypothetical protein
VLEREVVGLEAAKARRDRLTDTAANETMAGRSIMVVEDQQRC